MAGTVTIGCKLPHGLMLQAYEMVSVRRLLMGGGGYEEVSEARPKGNAVRIRGVAHPVDRAPRHQIIGGYALTHNVDADFWAAWLKANHDFDPVVKGLLFATEKPASAEAKAKEQRAIKSGFEPLNPDKDLRAPGVKKFDQSDQDAA